MKKLEIRIIMSKYNINMRNEPAFWTIKPRYLDAFIKRINFRKLGIRPV